MGSFLVTPMNTKGLCQSPGAWHVHFPKLTEDGRILEAGGLQESMRFKMVEDVPERISQAPQGSRPRVEGPGSKCPLEGPRPFWGLRPRIAAGPLETHFGGGGLLSLLNVRFNPRAPGTAKVKISSGLPGERAENDVSQIR